MNTEQYYYIKQHIFPFFSFRQTAFSITHASLSCHKRNHQRIKICLSRLTFFAFLIQNVKYEQMKFHDTLIQKVVKDNHDKNTFYTNGLLSHFYIRTQTHLNTHFNTKIHKIRKKNFSIYTQKKLSPHRRMSSK